MFIDAWYEDFLTEFFTRSSRITFSFWQSCIVVESQDTGKSVNNDDVLDVIKSRKARYE
jgi:hypothetical protein